MATTTAPVQETERIHSLDVLRGVAVLGILAMNIWSFAMPFNAYINPTSFGDLSGANWWAWLVSHLVFEFKFMTIFSMLFGAGVFLMTARVEARGVPPARLHYRRMGWLILFGLLHAFLLWYGDILFVYGVCGLLVYVFRRRSPHSLLAIGLAAILLAWLISIGMGTLIQFAPEQVREEVSRENWNRPPEAIQAEIEAYRGGWWRQMEHRAPFALFFQLFGLVMFLVWRAGGTMLLGMALFQWGVFSGRRSARFYWTLVALGALVGLPVVYYGVVQQFAHNWSFEYSMFFGGLYNYWASLLVALGWVGAVMLACRSDALRAFVRPFAAVGRMAFSNYLLQTVICTTLFYGHGFGLFGRLERIEQAGVVLAIWIFQLMISPLWLRRFQFGPLEWLWRSLTYGRMQPFRRPAPVVAPITG